MDSKPIKIAQLDKKLQNLIDHEAQINIEIQALRKELHNLKYATNQPGGSINIPESDQGITVL